MASMASNGDATARMQWSIWRPSTDPSSPQPTPTTVHDAMITKWCDQLRLCLLALNTVTLANAVSCHLLSHFVVALICMQDAMDTAELPLSDVVMYQDDPRDMQQLKMGLIYLYQHKLKMRYRSCQHAMSLLRSV